MPTYLMESPLEAKRLNEKAKPDYFIDRYIKHLIAGKVKMSKRSKPTILDVGCGGGGIAVAIAKRYPKFNVYGIDLNGNRFREQQKNSHLSNLIFLEQNARQMHFKDNEFSIVFSRFLLEYMGDPSLVISEMVRVARKGGLILLQDLDGQFLRNYPIDINLNKKINCIVKYLKKNKFDPCIGRKLFFLAKKNGLRHLRVLIEPYHLIAGKIAAKDYSLWKMKLAIARPHISNALGSESVARQFEKEYLRYLLNENTLTYSDLITVVGAKRA
jgi:ubiquinone/menaquinone biosynthesis C-methylase UbiE